MGRLTSLRSLFLKHNPLDTLPAEVSSLPSLRTLTWRPDEWGYSDSDDEEDDETDEYKKAFCAEAKCMQELFERYKNQFPKGFNEFFEYQRDGLPPCDLGGDGGCTPGFARFSEMFGPTRVWWMDADGDIWYQDFIDGQAGPRSLAPYQ